MAALLATIQPVLGSFAFFGGAVDLDTVHLVVGGILYGAVWVTQDIDSRKRAAYAAEVRRLGVSAVFLRAPRAKQGKSMKDRFAQIARWMPWLEDRLSGKRPRYFLIQTRGEPRELRRQGRSTAKVVRASDCESHAPSALSDKRSQILTI